MFNNIINNDNFWASIQSIIADGYTAEGLDTLDRYAEQFINDKILFQRFSSSEQHGCAAGGPTNVIATLLAAASAGTDSVTSPIGSFKREQQLAAEQESCIEAWAKKSGCWIENCDLALALKFGDQIAEGGEAKVYFRGTELVKAIGPDYFIQPIFSLDRITLHNTWFPETRLKVLGFGRSSTGDFSIIVEQPFIQGERMTQSEIRDFAIRLGFAEINPKNWTYATPEIYLSDLHDENIIKSQRGNIFVIDCDIRINTPELKCGGIRQPVNHVLINM